MGSGGVSYGPAAVLAHLFAKQYKGRPTTVTEDATLVQKMTVYGRSNC